MAVEIAIDNECHYTPKAKREGGDAGVSGEEACQHGDARGTESRGMPRSRFGFTCGRRIASPVLDNHVVQAGLMLAGFFLPLAITLLTLPRLPQRGGEQVAAAAPDATAPERKTAPTQQPPAADTGTADTPGTNEPAEKQPAVVAPFHRAKKRLAKGDYMAAICDFDDVLVAKPDFTWCRFYRAGAYYRMGNQTKALDDLNEALGAMPAEARIWRARGMVHERVGHLILALSDVCRAVELTHDGDESDAALAKAVTAKAEQLLDALNRHARGALLSGDYPTAIAEFSEIVRHRPDFASAWLCRAVTYNASGRFDDALDDLNIALHLRPGPAEAFKLRSILHERRQDYAPALADMRAAQRLDRGQAEYGERIRWLPRQQQAQHSQQLAAQWRLR